MRVLLVNNCHYRRGGADVVYLNTGELLERKGHEVFYFSQLNEKNIKCSTEDYFIHSVDFFNNSLISRISLVFRFFYSFEAKRKIERIILDKKPDIAHLHIYKGTLTPSILQVLKKHKVPIIQTLHDYGLLCPHNSFINGEGEICTRCYNTGNNFNCVLYKCNHNSLLLSLFSYIEYTLQSIFSPFQKTIDGFITVCDFTYNLHKAKMKDHSKLFRLYNFRPSKNCNESTLLLGDYYLFFGRISSEKGLVTLLKAWSNVKISRRLLIAGDGPQKEEIEKFTKEKKLFNVEFLGFKNEEELERLIINAYFIIVPSEINENNPLSIVESYSLGKPVIASSVGGIPEILIDGETGLLFEMNNDKDLTRKIELAEQLSKEKYECFSKNANSFAKKNFSEGGHYNSLMTIYNSVLKYASDK